MVMCRGSPRHHESVIHLQNDATIAGTAFGSGVVGDGPKRSVADRPQAARGHAWKLGGPPTNASPLSLTGIKTRASARG